MTFRIRPNHYAPTSTTMSKADLARKLGVSRTYITLLTQGKRKPSKEIVDKLARLSLTVDMRDGSRISGLLTQLNEYAAFNQGVTGSRPVRPSKLCVR